MVRVAVIKGIGGDGQVIGTKQYITPLTKEVTYSAFKLARDQVQDGNRLTMTKYDIENNTVVHPIGMKGIRDANKRWAEDSLDDMFEEFTTPKSNFVVNPKEFDEWLKWKKAREDKGEDQYQ